MNKHLVSAIYTFAFLLVCVIVNTLVYRYFPFVLNQNFFLGLSGTGFGVSAVFLLVVIIIGIIWHNFSALAIPYSMVLAGALSNNIDRFRFGGVLDYFNFFQVNYFNLADVLILVGIGWITYKLIFIPNKKVVL